MLSYYMVHVVFQKYQTVSNMEKKMHAMIILPFKNEECKHKETEKKFKQQFKYDNFNLILPELYFV